MMMATPEVLNLASYLHGSLNLIAPVETLKLQKLLYYCNAWSLALRDRPMFTDQIQAWKHGPVVASLYRLHRTESVIEEWPHGEGQLVPKDDQELANQIIQLYGGRSGWALREMTHQESPWIDAWKASDNGRIKGFEISPEAMKSYYRDQLEHAVSTED